MLPIPPPRLLVPFALCVLAAATSGQGMGASEAGLFMMQHVGGGGGITLTPQNNSSTTTLGQVGTGPQMTSANYQLRDGVSWGPSLVNSNKPIITGTRAGSGDKDGGDQILVFGYNLAASGAGLPTVEFADGFGTNPSVVSNTRIQITTPSGLNPNGNPLGPSGVTLTNNHGTFDALSPYLYEPALVAGTHPVLGRPLDLQLFSDPGSINIFVFGKNISGLGVQLFPFDGAVEILQNFLFLTTAFVPTSSGVDTLSLQLPDDPGLSGFPVEFQVLSVDDFSFSSGAWSNRLTLTLLP